MIFSRFYREEYVALFNRCPADIMSLWFVGYGFASVALRTIQLSFPDTCGRGTPRGTRDGLIGNRNDFCFPSGLQKELNDYFKRQGLLAGNRNTDGSFNNQSSNANFWSSLVSGGSAWYRNVNSGNATVNRNANNQAYGFSVRCVKNWIAF
jgi:hypothetical protein